MMLSLGVQKLFSFTRSHLLLILVPMLMVFGKYFPMSVSSRVHPTFSLTTFIVFWVFGPWSLSFTQGDKYGPICILQFGQHHLFRMLLLAESSVFVFADCPSVCCVRTWRCREGLNCCAMCAIWRVN